MKAGAPNPFVKPGELKTYMTGLAEDFAKQTAALQKPS
jgi:metallo-beta-lactamase class B